MVTCKLLCIGDIGSGKTSLLVRYADDTFENSGAAATIGVDFKSKTVNVDGEEVTVEVWDTAGAERFGTMTSNFYRGTDGVVIVYDSSDSKTFDSLSAWLNDCQLNGCDNAEKLVLGNKSDLDCAVPVEKGQEYADGLGIPFAQVSAKTGDGVQEAFEVLVKAIVGQKKPASSGTSAVAISRTPAKAKKAKGTCAV